MAPLFSKAQIFSISAGESSFLFVEEWYDHVVSGKVVSVQELAALVGLRPRHTRRILRCATLSPEIIEALVTGKHRPDLTLDQALEQIPLDWQEQRRQILRTG